MLFDTAFLRRFDKNIIGKFSYLPSRIQTMKVSQAQHLLLVDSCLPCDMFNIICCNGDTSPSLIRENRDYFRSKELPYAFWIGFEDEPLWLEEELQKLGMVTDEMEWAMACDLTQYQDQFTYSDAEKISNSGGIRDLIEVMKEIFPKNEHGAIESFYLQSEAYLLSKDSQLIYFVQHDEGKPVSLVSVYFDEGVASIFDVIVLPEMRGRGFGKKMTQRAMLEAKERGFETIILTATNDARHLYRKLGFVDVKTMKVYHEAS